jgi:hypothetical protein
MVYFVSRNFIIHYLKYMPKRFFTKFNNYVNRFASNETVFIYNNSNYINLLNL